MRERLSASQAPSALRVSDPVDGENLAVSATGPGLGAVYFYCSARRAVPGVRFFGMVQRQI